MGIPRYCYIYIRPQVNAYSSLSFFFSSSSSNLFISHQKYTIMSYFCSPCFGTSFPFPLLVYLFLYINPLQSARNHTKTLHTSFFSFYTSFQHPPPIHKPSQTFRTTRMLEFSYHTFPFQLHSPLQFPLTPQSPKHQHDYTGRKEHKVGKV